MTGGRRGLCGAGAAAARGFGGGFARGVGRGGIPWGGGLGRCFGGRGGWWRGSTAWGRGFYWGPPSSTQEADALRSELALARDEIAAMEARLAELEKEK